MNKILYNHVFKSYALIISDRIEATCGSFPEELLKNVPNNQTIYTDLAEVVILEVWEKIRAYYILTILEKKEII